MKTVVSSKGQIVIPAELRHQDDIKAGQQFEIERVEAGEYRLKRKTRERNEGIIELLQACPVKDWFVPFDRTVTTDDIQPPTFE